MSRNEQSAISAKTPVQWFLALCTVLIVGAGHWFIQRWIPHEPPVKGAIAKWTYRAESDAVFDLHETHAAEALAAKRNYLPIYDLSVDALLQQKDAIVKAVLDQPQSLWSWPQIKSVTSRPTLLDDGSVGDGTEEGETSDLQEHHLSADLGRGDSQINDSGVLPTSIPVDPILKLKLSRREDLQKLTYGCLKLLEPLYQRGVILDSEFPNEKSHIRLRQGKGFREIDVRSLVRFSELRTILVASTNQFFYRLPLSVRSEVIDFILQRLPANLVYAKENNKFIADISHITGLKVIQIKRGEILVRRGQVIDIRAYHAIRASHAYAKVIPRSSRLLGRSFLLLLLLMVFVIIAREVSPSTFQEGRNLTLVLALFSFFAICGGWALAIYPIHALLIPHAALALVIAVCFGRLAALLVGVTVAMGLGFILYLDLSLMLVGTVGGIMGATALRFRKSRSFIPAGILVGIAQAITHEALRAAAGRPQTYEEMWSAAQAFTGGILAGVLALLLLPFCQRWFGVASRGQLKRLATYKFPLLTKMRKHAPDIFTHSLRVENLADRAAKVIGIDRLLVRVCALYHDIGKLESETSEGPWPDIKAAARARREHIERGIRIAKEFRFPREVIDSITEHHGTIQMRGLVSQLKDDMSAEEIEQLRFYGPRPQKIESAIVMIANYVEEKRLIGVDDPVRQAVAELLCDFQFAECKLTLEELRRIEKELQRYIEEGEKGV